MTAALVSIISRVITSQPVSYTHLDVYKRQLAHLLIPIITSVIFLIYYFFSPWNENMKVIAFYQAIGAGLPVLIGIFTASVIDVYKRQVRHI